MRLVFSSQPKGYSAEGTGPAVCPLPAAPQVYQHRVAGRVALRSESLLTKAARPGALLAMNGRVMAIQTEPVFKPLPTDVADSWPMSGILVQPEMSGQVEHRLEADATDAAQPLVDGQAVLAAALLASKRLVAVGTGQAQPHLMLLLPVLGEQSPGPHLQPTVFTADGSGCGSRIGSCTSSRTRWDSGSSSR